jgi:hypothetical protein
MGQVYITQGHDGEQVEGYASSFSPQSDGALWDQHPQQSSKELDVSKQPSTRWWW